jgi:hypothetical protein
VGAVEGKFNRGDAEKEEMGERASDFGNEWSRERAQETQRRKGSAAFLSPLFRVRLAKIFASLG